jgi:uncharacterized protein (TIGR03382 family)
MTSIEVAPTDPQRLYVSGFRPVGDLRDALLFVSLDDGMHWTERPTPPLNQTNEAEVYIAAVDPTNADRVYLRTGGLGASRLFVTANAGGAFQIPLTLTHQMLGFALSPDGTKVYAGGPADGLYSATSSGLSFQHVSTLGVECLATHGPALWACSVDGPGAFVAGESSDEGATFAAKLHLSGIRAPLSCAADATASQCTGAPFQELCQAFHCGGSAADAGDGGGADASPAGNPDAAGDGEASTPPMAQPTRSSCGCSAVGEDGCAASAAVGLLVTGAIYRRRASPRRGCP